MIEFVITPRQIDRWAELTGDRNPLHLSAGDGLQERFGGQIAHGHLVTALILESLEDLAGVGEAGVRRLERVSFLAPTRPGLPYRLEFTPSPPRAGGRAWRFELTQVDTGRTCVEGLAAVAEPEAR